MKGLVHTITHHKASAAAMGVLFLITAGITFAGETGGSFNLEGNAAAILIAGQSIDPENAEADRNAAFEMTKFLGFCESVSIPCLIVSTGSGYESFPGLRVLSMRGRLIRAEAGSSVLENASLMAKLDGSDIDTIIIASFNATPETAATFESAAEMGFKICTSDYLIHESDNQNNGFVFLQNFLRIKKSGYCFEDHSTLIEMIEARVDRAGVFTPPPFTEGI